MASTASVNELTKTVVTDQDETIAPFCQSIEAILRQGLKRGLGKFGLADRDYWNCIEGLTNSTRVCGSLPLSVCHVISTVQQCTKVNTSQGRGRLFIRMALSKGVLDETVRFLMNSPKYIRYWYSDSSLFINYAEKGVVLELLKVVSRKTYKLNLSNCSFLDETWLLPEIQHLEFVPCALIGLTLYAVQGRSIITSVVSGSLASERGVVPGDCLDELFGQHINEKWVTRVGQLRRQNQGKPVTAIVIKGQSSDGRWFAPIISRYRTCRMDSLPCSSPQPSRSLDDPSAKDHERARAQHEFECIYLGYVGVGSKGSCAVAQDGIQNMLKAGNYEKKRVKLQLQERDIIVTAETSGETIGQFSYTETSSCAVNEKSPCHFGFVVGNTSCSLADRFDCHVFEADRPGVAHQIVLGIGKGFDRTVYCV